MLYHYKYVTTDKIFLKSYKKGVDNRKVITYKTRYRPRGG